MLSLVVRKDEIIPAIEEAKKLGINANGLTCDTSFITAFKNKEYDPVGMYHDALQAGLKAFGFDRGVTVQSMPIPITTPAWNCI